MRTLFTLLTLVFLSGCASNPYVIDKAEVPDHSTVKGFSQRDGLFTWMSFRIESIDGKTVSYVLKSETDYEIPVTPDTHRFVIFAQFNNSFGGSCPCDTFLELEAAISPNSAYGLKGRVNGASMEVWLENLDAGTVVSEVASANYRSSPVPAYVPIFVY